MQALIVLEGAYEASAKDRSCKHVVVAAWQRPTYFCMLKEANDKTTIVQSAAMREGFEVFDLEHRL